MKRLLLLVITAATLALGAESGNDLFQKALVLERTDGKPAEAIKLYQRIVDKFASDRKLAAKALLQMGRCYERLGQADARRTYERLVKEYGDQNDTVAEARTRLAALIAAEGKPKFTKIRVPTGFPPNTRFAFSPDGRELAYLSGGSVWLVPVHGATDPTIAGAPRQITQPVKSWTETTNITWSRDGNWLALHVRESGAPDNEYAVYMVRATGGEPRQVTLEPKSRERIFHDCRLSLSPDGKRLLYATWPEGGSPAERSVYLAPTDGGPATRLTQPITSDPAFSPDGKKIAYLRLVSGPGWGPDGERGRQLWVAPVEGGSPVLVYELAAPGRIAGPTWSPDGKTLAVLVNHDDRTDECHEILLIPVGTDGRASGSPVSLTLPYTATQWWVDWSPGNRIGLILRKPGETAVYTVPSGGGKAVQLTPDWAQLPSWTPDGRRIYFAGTHFDRFGNIEYIPSQGGKMERILFRAPGPNPLHFSYPGTGISVSPDGKRILFMGSYRGTASRRAQIFTVPVEGGDVAELTRGIPATNPCWSPDGESVAFIGWEEAGDKKFTRNIYAVPAAGGQTRKITSQSDQVANAGIAWSPDGSQIAFHSEGGQKIKLIQVAGGPAGVLVEGLTGNRPITNLAWSPDGKDLLYTTQDRIWKLNLGTGKSVEVQTGLGAVQVDMAWSPDGKTIAFTGIQGGEPELWLMEDFLPTRQAGR